MSISLQAPDWVSLLRDPALGTLGTSLAALLLVPAAVSAPAPAQQPSLRREAIEVIATVPDGISGVRTSRGFYYRSPHGLTEFEWDPTPSDPTQDAEDGYQVTADLSRTLISLSGLKVTELCDALDVSRTTYHKWLNGEGMSEEHMARIKEMVTTLHTLRDIREDDLRSFLLSETPIGKPLTLLSAGGRDALVGLALQRPAGSVVRSQLSDAARQQIGISGWLRPARRRAWIPSRLTEDELYQAMDRLNRTSTADNTGRDVEPESDLDAGYVAYGFIPE